MLKNEKKTRQIAMGQPLLQPQQPQALTPGSLHRRHRNLKFKFRHHNIRRHYVIFLKNLD